MVEVGVPLTDNLFRASAVVGVTPGRAAAVLVVVVGAPLKDVREVAVLGVVVVGVVPSRRVAVDELDEARVLLSAAVLPGLETMELVRRVDVVGFFSSSLALTLGRLLWLPMELAVVGRRTVEVAGGRVGGLLKPPGARVLVAVLAVADEATPGRRVAVVEATPGRFTAGLASPFDLVGASGEVGVEAWEVAVLATGEATDPASDSASAMDSTGGTSSC